MQEATLFQTKLQIPPIRPELVSRPRLVGEIASRLFLSLNTVKAHTRNVYGKLGVHSLTQAVARARATGVLSST